MYLFELSPSGREHEFTSKIKLFILSSSLEKDEDLFVFDIIYL